MTKYISALPRSFEATSVNICTAASAAEISIFLSSADSYKSPAMKNANISLIISEGWNMSPKTLKFSLEPFITLPAIRTMSRPAIPTPPYTQVSFFKKLSFLMSIGTIRNNTQLHAIIINCLLAWAVLRRASIMKPMDSIISIWHSSRLFTSR